MLKFVWRSYCLSSILRILYVSKLNLDAFLYPLFISFWNGVDGVFIDFTLNMILFFSMSEYLWSAINFASFSASSSMFSFEMLLYGPKMRYWWLMALISSFVSSSESWNMSNELQDVPLKGSVNTVIVSKNTILSWNLNYELSNYNLRSYTAIVVF